MLDPQDWHGYASETVWAQSLGEHKYCLRNTPFFAMGVSAEDVVVAGEEDGALMFESVASAGGHSSYRIILDEGTPAEVFETHWARLEALGCTYEGAELSVNLLAVDVPADTDIYAAYAALEEGEQAQAWYFEEGHCGHTLRH